MRYFVMEHIHIENETVRRPQGYAAEIRETSDLSAFYGIDFSARDGLISERLKLLMERYMPKYRFTPVVFLDAKKQEQIGFWRFSPPILAPARYQAEYKNTGVISRIDVTSEDAPVVFSVRAPKGAWSVVVHAAVAESMLRRGIFGVKLTRLN